MRRHTLTLIIVGLVLLAPAMLNAQGTYPNRAAPYVNDFAGVLSTDTETTLTETLTALDATDNIEIAVVTLPTFTDYTSASFEDFATGLFNNWGIGDAALNNGVMLLIAVEDRKVRLELGAGYDANMDSAMQTVLSEYIAPRLRDDDFDGAVLRGIPTVIERVTGEVAAPAGGGLLAGIVGWVVGHLEWTVGILLAGVLIGIRGIRGAIYNASPRSHTMRCPQCRKRMTQVDDIKDLKQYLTPGQLAEQRANDAYYSVWYCPNGHTYTEAPRQIKNAKSCPQCHNKTMRKGGSKTVLEPTTQAYGQREHYTTCLNCGYQAVTVESIPRILTPEEIAQREAEQARRQEEAARRSHWQHNDYDDNDWANDSSSGWDGGSSDDGGGSSDGGGASDDF